MLIRPLSGSMSAQSTSSLPSSSPSPMAAATPVPVVSTTSNTVSSPRPESVIVGVPVLPTQTQSSPSLGTRDRGGKGSKEELISPRVDRRSTLWQRTLFDYLLVLSIIVSSSRLIVALLYIAAPKPTTPLTLSIDTFPVHHYDALPIPPARPPQVHIVITCNCITTLD